MKWRFALLLAVLWFLYHGPLRALTESGDFFTLWAASRVWLHGGNPYSIDDLVATAHVPATQFLATPMLYLPQALLLITPLAALPWAVARAIWLLLMCAAVAGTALWMKRMNGRLPLAVCAFLLAFAPLHTGMGRGQPAIIVCGLLAASASGAGIAPGLALGLALCLKPQLSLGILLCALVWRNRPQLIAACATVAALTIGSLVIAGPAPFRGAIAAVLSVDPVSGRVAGASPEALGFQLINIDTILPDAFYAPAVYAGIAVITILAILNARNRKIAIAVAASATLLCGYHRFYDAQILTLALPAVLDMRRPLRLALSAALALFLLPLQTMAANIGYGVYRLFGRADALPVPDSFAPLLHIQAILCVLIWSLLSVVSLKSAPSTPASPR